MSCETSYLNRVLDVMIPDSCRGLMPAFMQDTCGRLPLMGGAEAKTVRLYAGTCQLIGYHGYQWDVCDDLGTPLLLSQHWNIALKDYSVNSFMYELQAIVRWTASQYPEKWKAFPEEHWNSLAIRFGCSLWCWLVAKARPENPSLLDIVQILCVLCLQDDLLTFQPLLPLLLSESRSIQLDLNTSTRTRLVCFTDL